MNETITILCTCPDEASANMISKELVGQGVAACVNILPGISSTYLWQGEIETSHEILLLIKSVSARYPELERIIVSLHPYELPEIIAVSVDRGLPDYLHWVKQCTEQPT